MIVSEFIEWLKTQDQEAIVEVVVQLDSSMYESYGPCEIVSLDINNDEHVDYIDFRGNQFVNKGTPHFNKRYLKLGSGQ